jgi:predicted metalloprotease with PDZ domain
MTRLSAAVLFALSAMSPTVAHAQTAPPVDTPYAPGTIAIHVDATDLSHRIFRVSEKIPVQAGPLTLLYPQWLPGNHSPSGPINKLAGLTITAHGGSANGQRIAWTRDPLDVYAFKLEVPAGVASIDVAFEYLSATDPVQGRIVMTPAMLNLQWNTVALYPAGHYARAITMAPSVALPSGWQAGTALELDTRTDGGRNGDVLTYKPVDFDTLVDSPLVAGRYYKRVDLDPGAKVPVHLDLFADAPKYLEMTPQQLQLHRNLVTQAYKLFDSRHYKHYDFLFWQSDVMSGKGLEHHQSSEDGVKTGWFSDWDKRAAGRDLLGHEYTHSWNGKFMRPADLATPSFNVPMGDSLLWVYEGQTQYWGFVLTARAGLWTPDEFRDALALVAARYDRGRTGFDWRTLADTTNDPTIAQRAPLPYRNWQMSEEYYSAGQLLWLAVDAKIRALTHGRKSLDTFAKNFFGVDDGSVATRTYTFDDVVKALDGVAEYDWATFLRARLDAHQPPLDGLEAAGWKLVYTDKQSEFEKQLAERYHYQPGFMFSIGLAVDKDGKLRDVRWNGPAFKAGIGSGETLVAVNGQAYKPEVLADAITLAKDDKAPIELLLKYQDRYRTVAVDYHAGLQYPHLVRVEDAPDYLSKIVRAK